MRLLVGPGDLGGEEVRASEQVRQAHVRRVECRFIHPADSGRGQSQKVNRPGRHVAPKYLDAVQINDDSIVALHADHELCEVRWRGRDEGSTIISGDVFVDRVRAEAVGRAGKDAIGVSITKHGGTARPTRVVEAIAPPGGAEVHAPIVILPDLACGNERDRWAGAYIIECRRAQGGVLVGRHGQAGFGSEGHGNRLRGTKLRPVYPIGSDVSAEGVAAAR